MRTTDPCIYTHQHITNSLLEDLESDINMRIGDPSLPGFHVRYSSRTQKKVFYFWYKARNTRRQYNVKLGLYPILTLVNAKKQASVLYGKVAAGQDPVLLQKEEDKKRQQEFIQQQKFKDLMDNYLENYSKPNKKPRTYTGELSLTKNHIYPALGKIPINEVTPDIIEKLKNTVGEKHKATSNAIIALLSHFFNWCEIHKYTPQNSNPCTHIKKYVLEGRDRVLPNDYYKKFYDALELGRILKQSEPVCFDIIEFIFLTGCRSSEAKDLDWASVDMDNHILRLARTKRGRRSLPFGEPALKLLEKAKANRIKDCPYVFPSSKTHLPFNNIRKAWAWVMKQIGLDDFRVHDLRHNFTTEGVLSGEDIAVVSKVVGHTNITTTQRYTHLNNLKGIEAANHISKRLMAKVANA